MEGSYRQWQEGCEKKRKRLFAEAAGPPGSQPGVYICNECVSLCSDILDEEMFESGR